MANSDYSINGFSTDFTPLAETAQDTDYMDRTIYLGRANFPRTDSLKVGMAALINDEFMQVTALAPGRVSVKRGCADTVPARHAAMSLIWFMGVDTIGTDGKEYAAGETTGVKYSPYTTGGGAYPLDPQAPDAVTYDFRFYRPYPPGAMRVNSRRWYEEGFVISSDSPNMRLTWAHRDRILEADRLIDHDVGSIGPEKGTTYTVRIYDGPRLLRTEVGIMATPRDKRGNLLSPTWVYTWAQAMQDFGFVIPPEDAELVRGTMTIFSTRDGFDSWQGYTIQFDLNVQGHYVKVAQLGQLAAQRYEDEPGTAPVNGAVYAAQLAQQAMQTFQPSDDDPDRITAGVYVAQLAESAAQDTAFYTGMNRNLFEAPYAFLALLGRPRENTTIITTVARPSDRLTDSHSIWTRYDWPVNSGAVLPYDRVVSPAQFTPWITLDEDIAQLDTQVKVRTSSFYDGVSLVDVLPGQVAMVGAEIVRIESVTEDVIAIARGCYDTVPARHRADARMWFFGAASGRDPSDYPIKISGGVLGAAVQVKMVPDTFSTPLSLLDVPTDRVDMKLRTRRPYPPGQVMINGKRWFQGGQYVDGQSMLITWVHRDRVAQDSAVIDHLAADQGAESEQTYRLTITVTVNPPAPARSYPVIVRRAEVDGTAFEYTWEMIKADGYRAGGLLGVCGRVTVGIVLESIRFGLTSWQNYTIPLLLPASRCAPGQSPGGGQLPGGGGSTGGGNGTTGPLDPGGTAPGGDNQGDGPADPVDNGSGGDNGNGPPLPPEVPPDWPDPIEPPDPVDPDDPNPGLAAHWDVNWDRHWDAYKKDNQGE